MTDHITDDEILDTLEFPEGTSKDTYDVDFLPLRYDPNNWWAAMIAKIKYTEEGYFGNNTLPPHFIFVVDNQIVLEFNPDNLTDPYNDEWIHLRHPFIWDRTDLVLKKSQPKSVGMLLAE